MSSLTQAVPFHPLWRVSLAILFASLVTLCVFIQKRVMADEGGDGTMDKSPDNTDDSHTFDIRGMDRTEMTRAFAGQLTVLPEAPAALARKEIVFVDPGVPNRESLLHSLRVKAKVIELAPGRDGLSQIAEAFLSEHDISALHIISHGGEARIKLAGSADVSIATLPEHIEQLQAIHNAMAANGDVLLYGCDIAKGNDGKRFVNLLAQLTGENVAASENLTGSSRRGGDSELEYRTGTIRTQALAPDASENYDDVLSTVTVSTTADSGAGSLRAVIAGATSGDTIVFAPALANQIITLTTTGDTTLGPSALAVTKTLTIDGSAAPGLTISGDTTNLTRRLRLFVVTGAGNLTLKNLTLSNGRFRGGDGASCGDFEGAGGGAAGLGGAVCSYNGVLNLVGCTLTGNSAIGGDGAPIGGLDAEAGGGGGLNGDGFVGTPHGGGGNGGGPNGGAGGNGNPGGNATGVGGGGGGAFGGGGGSSAFGGGTGGNHYPNNSGGGGAGMGGALFCSGGPLNVTNCTLTGNSAIGGTGSNNGQGLGGGIFIGNCNATILNCTIDDNTAAEGGGGIFNLGDGATSNVTMNNTIVADSHAGVTDFVGVTNGGTINTQGAGNLIPSATPTLALAIAIITTPTHVSALANNGGPAQTMALTAGSPAINAASNGIAPATDQRNLFRPDAADIGAFEFGGTLHVAAATLPAAQVEAAYNQQTFTASGGTAPYAFTVSSGALPAGLSLSTGGVLSGTPTESGNFSFTVKATDSSTGTGPYSGTQNFALTSAPVITSTPTATPNPAFASQNIHFSTAASGSALTFSWDFGDGTPGDGSAVTHAYSTAGVYTAKVTATDGAGLSATNSVSVTVDTFDSITDATGDANSDGFPNDFEIAFGLNQLAENTTPFGEALVAPADEASLKPAKISIKLSFKQNDTISVSGTLPIARGFKPIGENVAVFISGALAQYKLNAKGAATGKSTFKLTTKINKDGTAIGGPSVKFSATFLKGDYATALAPAGFNNATSFSQSLPVHIIVYIDNHLYIADVNVMYKATKGKTGSAK